MLFRYGESRGAGAGGERIPHALPPGLPGVSAWDDEAVLEEGSGWEAHVRVHPVLLGRLLHSYRATVPARGQPLVCGAGGELWCCREVHQWKINESSAKPRTLSPKPWRKEVSQTSPHPHWQNLHRQEKQKKKRVFWSRGLSLVFNRGPNIGGRCQVCRLMLVRWALGTLLIRIIHTDWPQHCDQ